MTDIAIEDIKTLISYLPDATEPQQEVKKKFTQESDSIQPGNVSRYITLDNHSMRQQPIYTTEELTYQILVVLKEDFQSNRDIIRTNLEALPKDHEGRKLLESLSDLSFTPMRAKRFHELAQFLQNDIKDFDALKKAFDENSQDLCMPGILISRTFYSYFSFLSVPLLLAPSVFCFPLLFQPFPLAIITIPLWITIVTFNALFMAGLILAAETVINKIFPSTTKDIDITSVQGKTEAIELPTGNNKCNKPSFWKNAPEHLAMMSFQPKESVAPTLN